MSDKARLWWVSWEEHKSPSDYRPQHFPPRPGVLAWWCSGHGDGYATMVALVNAKDEAAVERALAKDWPTDKRGRVWRFMNETPERPFTMNDRFPFQQWSIDRLKALGVAHDVEVSP